MRPTRRSVLLSMLSAASSGLANSGPVYAAPSPVAAASVETLQALLDGFRLSPGMSAKFLEKKHITLLKKPLVNAGRIYFISPDMFARHTDTPFPSSVLVTQKQVTLWDGKKQRVLQLEQRPALAQLTSTFLLLLGGDLGSLRKAYTPTFSKGKTGWTLALAPNSEGLKQLVKGIRVDGNGLTLTRMTLVEASGDRAETEFSAQQTARTYSPDELSQYFAIKRS